MVTVLVELEMVTGAGEETEVAAAGERGYHGNELQHGLKMFFGSFHWPTLHSTTQVMPLPNNDGDVERWCELHGLQTVV